ncbi:MAG: hypothetical protein ACOX8X_06355 [Methanomethylophilus sp.]
MRSKSSPSRFRQTLSARSMTFSISSVPMSLNISAVISSAYMRRRAASSFPFSVRTTL